MRRATIIVGLLLAGIPASATASPARYRACSLYVNFAHLTGVRGISCATGSLIAEAYANLVLAGGPPYPKHLAHYTCTARDPHPNSVDDHIAVVCSRGSKAIRFIVGP